MPDPQKNMEAKLQEDLGSPQEAAEMRGVIEALHGWEAPAPTPENRARLHAALHAALPEAPESPRKSASIPFRTRLQNARLFLLLRAQMGIVRREIWGATALVMGLGLAVGPLSSPMLHESTVYPELEHALLLVLLAPIAAAIGMAFLYGPEVDPSMEIIEATPTSQQVILLARMALVFGFNLGLGLLGSAVLVLLGQNGLNGTAVGFFTLVGTWLAPMAFLSSLAFGLSILLNDPLAGALFSTALWALQTFRTFLGPGTVIYALDIPNLLSTRTHPWLWALSLLWVSAGLWWAANNQRWVSRLPRG